jgi:hypothetical protein
MPKNHGRNSKSAKRTGKGSRRNITGAMADLGLSGTRQDDHLIVADLTYRPVTPYFSAKPPRRLLNQIYWVRQEFSTSISTTTTVPVETNYDWTAVTNMAQYPQFLAVFDQYYLHSVVATFSNSSSASATLLPQLYTAIDFDNVIPIGSIGAISAYSTVNNDVLAGGKSVTRVIMPCMRTSAETSNAAAITRLWISSAVPGIPFYGLRTIVNTTSAVTNIDVTFAYIWAFRNSV